MPIAIAHPCYDQEVIRTLVMALRAIRTCDESTPSVRLFAATALKAYVEDQISSALAHTFNHQNN